MKKYVTAYWLLPAKPERELFCEIIRILFKQFDAPNFDPHLTLLVTPHDRPAAKEVLRQIAASPIRLEVDRTGFSSKFTKTLFVRFKPNAALRKLVLNLARVTKSRKPAIRDPHVSLLYKTLPARMKADLAATIRLPFRKVTFDSIQAVRLTLPVRKRADVKAWRPIAKRFLRK